MGAHEVFDNFAAHLGLHVSIEKSTIYMAGIPTGLREEIMKKFPYEYGSLPFRYWVCH